MSWSRNTPKFVPMSNAERQRRWRLRNGKGPKGRATQGVTFLTQSVPVPPQLPVSAGVAAAVCPHCGK